METSQSFICRWVINVESLQKKALHFILMNIEWHGFEMVGHSELRKSLHALPLLPSLSPGCVPDSLGRVAFRSASRLFLWTAAFVLTKQIATQQLISSSDSYFEPSHNIFSQSFPLKCPINKYEIITVFGEGSWLFLFVQSCWQRVKHTEMCTNHECLMWLTWWAAEES